MKKNYRLICIVIFIMCGVFLYPAVWAAEEDITVLDTLIVTNSGTKTKLLDTNGSIHVLTKKDIKDSGHNNVADLISSIPGIINHRSSSKTYFSVRGTRTTMSAGPAIYVNGRPLNVGIYGYSKIDTISIDNIEKIEVIKSPPASKYGANAARGVILITTKTGKSAEDKFNGSGAFEYGSWDTIKLNGGLSGTMDKVDYSLFASSMETDGYRSSNDETQNADGQIGYKLDTGRLDFLVGINKSSTRYTTALPEWQVARDRTVSAVNSKEDGSGYLILPNETDEEFFNTQIKFDYDKGTWLFNTAFTFSLDKQTYTRMKDFYHTTLDKKRDDYRDDREEKQYDFKINGGKVFDFDTAEMSNTFTLGLDYKYADFDQVRTYPFNTTAFSSKMTSGKDKADIDATRKLLGLNLNNDFEINKFRFQTGIRLNYVKYELENKVPASISIDRDNDLDWSISPSYNILDNANLFVTWNHSHFYLPLSYYKSDMEKNNPYAQAKDLKPELYDTIEAGFKHRVSQAFNYSLMCYYTQVEDKLVSYYEGTSYQGYRNAGTSIHKGIEAEIDGKPLKWLGYRVSLATIDAEWDKGEAKAYETPDATSTSITNLAGNKVIYVPEYEYALGVDFYPFQDKPYGSLTFSLDLHGFGEQYEDYNNNLKMPKAHFVDIKVSWTLGNVNCHLTCSNLFDKEWDKVVNSLGKPHSGLYGFYPQDGRYVGIGVSYRF